MRAWSDPAYEVVARLVNARTGLVFRTNCCDAAEAGTRRAMERAGVADLTTYVELLREGAAAFADLIDELTVGETYFFRQPERFDFIRRHVLPEIRRRRGPDHVVRVWSAGCASGEEAYSLAILFEEEGIADRCSILATDISGVALQRARDASYGIASLRGIDESLLRRYFRRHGYREILEDRVRCRVTFRSSNLAADEPRQTGGMMGDMDLILCRNVLIYFDKNTVGEVGRRLFGALAAGGWLVTGASDPSLTDAAPFETVVTDRGVVYRRGSAPRRTGSRRSPIRALQTTGTACGEASVLAE